MEIVPVTGAVGAEVRGLELRSSVAEAACEDLHAAWLEHRVLFFRRQHLDAAGLARFARSFGELDVYPFVEPLPHHPHVVPIVKEPGQAMNFGGAWHSDTAYLERPPKGTALAAVEVPARGGDTLFADATAAFEALSPGMQTMLQPLRAVYTAAGVHGAGGAYTTDGDHPMAKRDPGALAEAEIEHPLIRSHPETGRRAIWCSPTHTRRLAGMTVAESRPLLDFLFAHATAAEYITRWRWADGDVALWDNRALLHYALNDYAGRRRVMYRVILAGDVPR